MFWTQQTTELNIQFRRNRELCNTIDLWVEAEKSWNKQRQQLQEDKIRLQKTIDTLKTENENLKHENKIEKCFNKARLACIEAFAKMHRDSILLKPSEKLLDKEGKPQIFILGVFRAHFDGCAKTLGLQNPERYRTDK